MNIVSLNENKQFVPTLAQWFHHQWGYLYPKRTIEDVIQKLKTPMVNGLPYIAVLTLHGEAIGTASLVINDMPGLDAVQDLTPWLASVYVTPEYRKQGVGETLLIAIEDKARELGFKKLYLFTPNKLEWYEKFGWQIQKQIEYQNQFVTIMSKVLE